jgi:hypothetical protein
VVVGKDGQGSGRAARLLALRETAWRRSASAGSASRRLRTAGWCTRSLARRLAMRGARDVQRVRGGGVVFALQRPLQHVQLVQLFSGEGQP